MPQPVEIVRLLMCRACGGGGGGGQVLGVLAKCISQYNALEKMIDYITQESYIL